MKSKKIMLYFVLFSLIPYVHAEINSVTITPDLSDKNNHLSYKAIEIQNNSKYPVQIDTTVLSANLKDKIDFCSSNEKNCFYKSTCVIGERVESNKSCLIWIQALRNEKSPVGNERGYLEFNYHYVYKVNRQDVFTKHQAKLKIDYIQSLFAGGTFTSPGRHIAKWNGKEWEALKEGVPLVLDMALFQGDLYVGTSGAENGFSKWDGKKWTALPKILSKLDQFYSMIGYKDKLFVGGELKSLSYDTTLIAWDGTTWSVISSANPFKMIRKLAVADNLIYVGSELPKLFGRGDGNKWEYLGSGLAEESIFSITHKNNDIYFGGFRGIVYKYDQQKITKVGSSLNRQISDMIFMNDQLYVATYWGPGVMQWDDEKGWKIVGTLQSADFRTLAASGGILYVGALSMLEPPISNFVAQWDGKNWARLGSGLNEYVGSLLIVPELKLET